VSIAVRSENCLSMFRSNQIIPNPRWLRRGYAEFEQLVRTAKAPIVLLEGSRSAPAEVLLKMEQLAAYLMQRFPSLIARSGNAEGSDQAWARGVNCVAPERLQLVLPVPNYKAQAILPANEVAALREVPPEDYHAARTLCREHYEYGPHKGPAVFDPLPPFKKPYLERDALKVLGHTDYSGKRRKATVALFYLDPNKRNGGGTGHTMRLCEAERVPYFLADDWLEWLQEERR
jgi:hypothetical protein